MSAHTFNPAVAKLVGLPAAVIHQNLTFWTEKNAANDKHFYEKRHWTYNSVKAFSELFDYLTPTQIRTALEKLETNGLLMSGNFNKSSYDRTKWYSPVSISEAGKDIKSDCSSDKIHLSNKANGFETTSEPIPVVNTDDKTHIVNNSKNIKKVSEKKSSSKQKKEKDFPPDHECVDTLSNFITFELATSFVDHRTNVKKQPITREALRLMVKNFSDDPNAEACFERSIMSNWTGVFPQNQKGTQNEKSKEQAMFDGFMSASLES